MPLKTPPGYYQTIKVSLTALSVSSRLMASNECQQM